MFILSLPVINVYVFIKRGAVDAYHVREAGVIHFPVIAGQKRFVFLNESRRKG